MSHPIEGKLLRHPLHPILVHMPIALFLISFAFDVGAICNQITSPAHFILPAFYTMLLGEFTAILAVTPGLIDYFSIRKDHPAKQTATYHLWLNVLAIVLYLLNIGVRWPTLNHSEPLVMPVTLSVWALVTLGISGYLGGKMVYDDGIAVGRYRQNGRRPGNTLLLDDRNPDAEGFIEVMDENRLRNRQIIRIERSGVVMAIARSAGQVFAFQDFCTHRYGPLSEGRLRDNQIVCPWHGSCFDMQNGKVCAGPASEPLRVLDIRVRDGKVWLRVPV